MPAIWDTFLMMPGKTMCFYYSQVRTIPMLMLCSC